MPKLIIIIILIFIFYIIDNIILYNSYKNELKNDIFNIEHYYKICNKGILLNKSIKKFKKYINPAISIISTAYNKEKYIIRFLRSIQNQNFDNIEIILIDDFSEDNSVMIIEDIQKIDERIKVIKHNTNMGTLISRNQGILISSGKYIIIPDIDDILSYNLFNKCLNTIEKTESDMILFNTYLGYKNQFLINSEKMIYQPKLSFFMFYGNGFLEIIDPVVRNKFIKRTTLINTLNNINDYFLNQFMIFYEDTLLNFMLYKTSKSLFTLKYIGYYYISNPDSTTKKYIDDQIFMNKLLMSFFIFLKYILNSTKNTKYEKDIANVILEKEFKNVLTYNNCNQINDNFNQYYTIIELYLNNRFISLSLKNKLNDIKELIMNKKKRN